MLNDNAEQETVTVVGSLCTAMDTRKKSTMNKAEIADSVLLGKIEKILVQSLKRNLRIILNHGVWMERINGKIWFFSRT